MRQGHAPRVLRRVRHRRPDHQLTFSPCGERRAGVPEPDTRRPSGPGNLTYSGRRMEAAPWRTRTAAHTAPGGPGTTAADAQGRPTDAPDPGTRRPGAPTDLPDPGGPADRDTRDPADPGEPAHPSRWADPGDRADRRTGTTAAGTPSRSLTHPRLAHARQPGVPGAVAPAQRPTHTGLTQFSPQSWRCTGHRSTWPSAH